MRALPAPIHPLGNPGNPTAASLACWSLTPSDARRLQEQIPSRVEPRDRFRPIRTVAGADVALMETTGYAAVILYSFPDLVEIERAWSCGTLRFPYIPGLLAFREMPLLLDAFQKLQRKPDLFLADAHGWAHPRRAGMACHLGLVLNTPTIGCAKSVLVGEYRMPASKPGSSSALLEGGETIGRVVRTRRDVRPVFVSIGHRLSLKTAVQLTLACCDGYRIPKPLRQADQWVKQLKRPEARR